MTHQRRTPAEAREVAYHRQDGSCWACWTGVRPEEGHLHHRRRRRDLTADELWCSCVTVLLHPDCHVVAPQSVHQRPEWARSVGLVVPSWGDQRVVPIIGGFVGSVLLDCSGGYSLT